MIIQVLLLLQILISSRLAISNQCKYFWIFQDLKDNISMIKMQCKPWNEVVAVNG